MKREVNREERTKNGSLDATLITEEARIWNSSYCAGLDGIL